MATRATETEGTEWDGGYVPELEDRPEPLQSAPRRALHLLPGRVSGLGLALGLGAGAMAAAPGMARADALPFGADVIEIRPVEGNSASAGGAQLMPGSSPSRLRMTFAAQQPDQSFAGASDIFQKEFELADGPNGVVVLRGLTTASVIPGMNNAQSVEESCVEIDRGDGQLTRISNPGSRGLSGSEVDVDGQARWNGNGGCNYNDGRYGVSFSLSNNPGEIIIAVHISYPGWQRGDSDVHRLPIAGENGLTDFCEILTARMDRLMTMGMDPYEAGVLDRQESTPRGENLFVEAGNLAAVNRDINAEIEGRYLMVRRADGSLAHLNRDANGRWTVETDPQRPRPDNDLGETVWAMLERYTPSGRRVTMLVQGEIRPDTSEPILKVRLLEEVSPEVFQEVSITMEESHQDIDADGDGLAEYNADGTPGPDLAPGRTDAAQVRVGGVIASQGADCADVGWPGREPARVRTPFGRPCTSEIPGYNGAEVRDDGSALHKREAGEVEVFEDGAVGIPSGQKVLWVHTRDVHVAPEDSSPTPRFVTAPGNSVTLTAHSTRRPDGSEGGPITLSVITFDNPFGAPTIVRVNAGETWQSDGPVVGVELVAAGTTFELEVGDENISVPVLPPTPTPTPSTPPGSGTPEPIETDEPQPTPSGEATNPPVTGEATPPASDEPTPPVTGEATPPASEDPTVRPVTPIPTERPGTPEPTMRPTDKPHEGGGGDSGCDTVPGQKNPAAMLILFGAAVLRVLRGRRREDQRAEAEIQ